MKRLLLAALLITTSFAIASPSAQAGQDQWISQGDHLTLPTSNALPLLETDSMQGRITSISGNRVQVILSNGKTQTYRINASRQQQYGLEVGSELTLQVRRLNNSVLAISEVNPIANEQSIPNVGQQPSNGLIAE